MLLVADADGIRAEVHVVRVPDGGADAHLVGESLNSSCGVGCCKRSGAVSFKLRLEESVVDSVEAVLTVVV